MRVIVAMMLVAALATAGPAGAQPAAMAGMGAQDAPCPASPAPLPAEFAGWANKTPLKAAANAAGADAARLVPGGAASLLLLATPAVGYAVAPSHPGDPASHGGVASFTVAAAGTYRVALDAGAWIDVVADGKALDSIAHGRGPACSGIRKIVEFALTPGRYLLQVAGAGAPTLAVMVTRKP